MNAIRMLADCMIYQNPELRLPYSSSNTHAQDSVVRASDATCYPLDEAVQYAREHAPPSGDAGPEEMEPAP